MKFILILMALLILLIFSFNLVSNHFTVSQADSMELLESGEPEPDQSEEVGEDDWEEYWTFFYFGEKLIESKEVMHRFTNLISGESVLLDTPYLPPRRS